MAPRKTERIVNLTICLLVTRKYLPKSQLRNIVEGYRDLSDAAFERTFERDKDELRRLGVPIQVGSFDPLFDDEPGYRIVRSDFELPPIELDAEEAAVLGVAARVWQHTSVDSATRSALAKLRAAGVDPDVAHLASLEPTVSASEPAFERLWNAVIDRTRVSFTYRNDERRTLEPWGVTSWRGRWYVVGRDVDRDATRMFRLSRISDLPKAVSKAEAFEVPEDLDVRQLVRALAPASLTGTALVAVRPGKAPALTRRGVAEDRVIEAQYPAGFELYEVGYSEMHALADEVLRYGADVIVLEPPELRAMVIDRLSAMLAARGRVA